MKQQEKERAYAVFSEINEASWTYARLSDSEKERLKEALERANQLIEGNYNQCFECFAVVKQAFLLALDYKPIGWRE